MIRLFRTSAALLLALAATSVIHAEENFAACPQFFAHGKPPVVAARFEAFLLQECPPGTVRNQNPAPRQKLPDSLPGHCLLVRIGEGKYPRGGVARVCPGFYFCRACNANSFSAWANRARASAYGRTTGPKKLICIVAMDAILSIYDK